MLAIGGIAVGGAPRGAGAGLAAAARFALMMIFVLYTFGGWNEGAYLAGEVRDARRNMVKVLAGGLVLVTALYLLVNWGYYARARPGRHQRVEGDRGRHHAR